MQVDTITKKKKRDKDITIEEKRVVLETLYKQWQVRYQLFDYPQDLFIRFFLGIDKEDFEELDDSEVEMILYNWTQIGAVLVHTIVELLDIEKLDSHTKQYIGVENTVNILGRNVTITIEKK